MEIPAEFQKYFGENHGLELVEKKTIQTTGLLSLHEEFIAIPKMKAHELGAFVDRQTSHHSEEPWRVFDLLNFSDVSLTLQIDRDSNDYPFAKLLIKGSDFHELFDLRIDTIRYPHTSLVVNHLSHFKNENQPIRFDKWMLEFLSEE